MNEEIKPIDFNTFVPGARYKIINPRNGQIFHYSHIGTFRKGIAIASNDTFDCLINIKCEIIYMPTSCFGFWGSESTRPRIYREIGGSYTVKSYKDVSAPGKDSNYQGPFIEDTLTENGDSVGKKTYLNVPVYDYPMSIPYERNKIVKHGNKFYDLETYKLICSHPDTPTFFVDSEFVDGVCEIHDEKYYKQLLVEVKEGKIVSFTDITLLESQLYKLEEETKERIILSADKIIKRQMSKELETIIYKFIDKPPILNLGDEPILKEWLETAAYIHDTIKEVHDLDWKVKLPWYSNHQGIEINFYSSFYTITVKYLATRIYIYNKSGERINENPYSVLFPIRSEKDFLPNHKIFCFGQGYIDIFGILVIGNTGKIAIYKFNEILKLRDGRFNIHKTGGGDPWNNCDASEIAICDGYHNTIPYEKRDFYDLTFNKLKNRVIEDILPYESIIDHYLYRTLDGKIHKHNDFANDTIEPYKVLNYIIIPSEKAIKETLLKINNKLNEGNPYISDIYKCNFFNSINKSMDSDFYIFEYQPYGKMNLKGEVKYDIDPTTVVL